MFSISRPLIALSAIIATGLVVADVAQSLPREATAAATVAHRFPQADEMLAPRSGAFTIETDKATRGNKATPSCTREHWPYIADECLVTTGETPRKPARTITTQRRLADNGAQASASQMATLDLRSR
jgi:hypothetical protein